MLLLDESHDASDVCHQRAEKSSSPALPTSALEAVCSDRAVEYAPAELREKVWCLTQVTAGLAPLE